jgi:hypothetical protein
MSREGLIEGSVDLVLAIFRLAVSDFLGESYDHDGGGGRRRLISRQHRAPAMAFLEGPWARYLADLIGLDGGAIWREARRLESAEGDVSIRLKCA